jgi:protein-tyrosine phosphatase
LIDLHCHILPGVDDGAADEAAALAMARIAVAEGVTVQACTPHIYPGVYPNTGPDILKRVAWFQELLDYEGIPLRVVAGADVHVAPDLVQRIRSGEVLTLNGSRYILIEPPHHILPPRVEEVFFNLQAAGYVPILTHPERMTWIDQRYDLIRTLARSGVWMQITGAAIAGKFGSRAVYWSHRMLDEGLVQIVASDAHDPVHRAPVWSEAVKALVARVGLEEKERLMVERPAAVLSDAWPDHLPTPVTDAAEDPEAGSIWRRVSGMLGGRQ